MLRSSSRSLKSLARSPLQLSTKDRTLSLGCCFGGWTGVGVDDDDGGGCCFPLPPPGVGDDEEEEDGAASALRGRVGGEGLLSRDDDDGDDDDAIVVLGVLVGREVVSRRELRRMGAPQTKPTIGGYAMVF